MSAVLIARVRALRGDVAVAELLRIAGVERPLEYLIDTGNWISHAEAAGLWRAGAQITHHPQFSRTVGEDSARRLNGSPVAALLRSLGSPENVLRQIATASKKFSTVSDLEAVEWGPGFAEIHLRMLPGFPPNVDHCAWTAGLLTQPSVLFGLPAARVEHDECQAFGAERCVFRITWPTGVEGDESSLSGQLDAMRAQLEAMRERLHGVFATASDLIAADEIDHVLARITDRAAVEVRAPRYLLSVSLPGSDEDLQYAKGFDDEPIDEYVRRIRAEHPASLPPHWLVAPVRSERNDYGQLLAVHQSGHAFFPQERDLLQVYARYAATALDSASALTEARRLYGQSRALLELSRKLAAAGTSDEVALRLVDAVPAVVDCDRVAVALWDDASGELVQRAVGAEGISVAVDADAAARWTPRPGSSIERFVANPSRAPLFVDAQTGDEGFRLHFGDLGAVASIIVPLTAPDVFLGFLSVSVYERPERLDPSGNLLDQLSGVAAQASTALQNGRLVDAITHQALHDSLTGLANRLHFADDLRAAVARAQPPSDVVALFYIDLDGFKPINDEFGHDVGDALLIAVGERLRASTRAEDTVARLGGDEFAVLVGARGTTRADLNRFAIRLAAQFREPFAVQGRRLRVGASVGRAVYPLDAVDADELLRAADSAMFEVKRAARPAGRAGA